MNSQAFYQTPFGLVRIGYANNKIISIKTIQKPGDKNEQDHPTAVTNLAFCQLTEYFQGKRRFFDFPMELQGTKFQVQVWKELQKIPYGETRTYKDIAVAIGKPNACRAVGMANHNNPLWIVVPCHRVIGSNKKLTGYAGGLFMKEALLRIEGQM